MHLKKFFPKFFLPNFGHIYNFTNKLLISLFTMKKFLLLSIALIGLLASCKSSSHVKCDAYGQIEQSDDFDIHAMSLDSSSKYVTSVKLK